MTVPRAHAGAAPVRRVHVQPHSVPLTHVGDSGQRIERANRRRTRAGDDRHNRSVLLPQLSQQIVQPVGIHPPPRIDSDPQHLSGPQPQHAGRTSDRIVGICVDDQHGWRTVAAEPLLPGILQRHVAGGQQCRQIRQGTSVRGESREFARFPPDQRPKSIHHRPLGSGRPGAHVVDRHRLVRRRTHRIEQAGQRHRGGYLMPDIPRIVEVVPAPQHQGDNLREVLQDPFSLRPGRQTAVQPICRLLHVGQRIAPGQHIAQAGLCAAQMLRQLIDQAVSGSPNQLRIIGGCNPLTRLRHLQTSEHGATAARTLPFRIDRRVVVSPRVRDARSSGPF